MSRSSRSLRFSTVVALAALFLVFPLVAGAETEALTSSCQETYSYFDGTCQVYEVYDWCIQRYCVQLACPPPHGDSESCWYF